MLDQQLLQLKKVAKTPVDPTRGVSGNEVADSMTKKIFNDGKIYLNEGAMAFKPLGMETVLETVDELRPSRKGVSSSNRWRVGPQTTEQNIALQQQLDFASAEDFVSFPRQKALNLDVREDSSYHSPALPRKYSNTGTSR